MTAADTQAPDAQALDWRWLTAAELATLKIPGWPATKQGVIEKIAREGWDAADKEWNPQSNPYGLWRRRKGKGGGNEYSYRLLPARKQAALAKKHTPERQDPVADRQALKAAIARDEAWEFYRRCPDAKKDAAKAKLAILAQVDDLVRSGKGKDDAARIVGREHDVSRATIFNWFGRVAGVNREDWLPYLLDHRAGKQRDPDTMHDQAWTLYKSLYLTAERRTHAECYNRVKDAAKEQGWKIPSDKTFVRRVDQDIEYRIQVLEREGVEAHDRLFPAQRRDRSGFHALEAVNYDGHKLDLFTLWPDGQDKDGRPKFKKGRTFLITFQDLYSTMIVGWRLDQAETAMSFRLAFGDVIENYGIPDHVWSDNTMAAAAKENTGGSRHRHRFKIKEDDPVGLFKLIGSEIHFTKPAHGQSKPIERAFGTLSRYISKSPECAGAYTGNNPLNKPHNYGEAEVSLEVLVAVAEREINRFNNDPALFAQGKGKSRAEVFAESYAASPVRVAKGLSDETRRMWLLASEPVTCRKPDGSVWLAENRYWHERLTGMIGAKVVLRFDPDRLHQPLHVYRLDGSFVCTAPCIDDVGFADTAAAKRDGAAKGAFRKATRDLAKAEDLLGMDKVAAMLPTPASAPLPEAKVVRPFFGAAGNLALAAQDQPEEQPDRQQETLNAFTKGMAALRLVSGND